jgi:hypothetical protein
MRRIIPLFIALGVTLSCSVASAASAFEDQLSAALKKSSFYRVRYHNPAVSPRTIYGVADINNGGADFDVTVKCFYTCENAAKFLTQLATAQETAEPCVGPPYLRIDFLSFGRTELSLSGNYSGACLSIGAKFYRLPESLTWKLYQSPLKDW